MPLSATDALLAKDALAAPGTSCFRPRPIVHMVGLGGSGMQALAKVFAAQGWRVRGSDNDSDACRALALAGYEVHLGHDTASIHSGTSLLVHSAAVSDDNPERIYASRLGTPVLSYAQAVGRLMTGPLRLAVAGTHGKSTITAMTGEILGAAGLRPTVICGAELVRGQESGVRSQDVTLVEACEYRGNFLELRPNRAVISGIEPDHVDCYPTTAELVDAFRQFAALLPGDGLLLAPADDPACQHIAATAGCRCETYGFSDTCDWRATDILSQAGRYSFTIEYGQQRIGPVSLRVAGRHNMFNALAAAALAASAGATTADIAHGLSRFAGLKRRLQYLGRRHGIERWDDYAHHPTAISVVATTLREMYPHARLCGVFEPHQAARTAALMDAFAAALAQLDFIAVTDIYRARETPEAGDVTAADLAERVARLGGNVLDEHRIDHVVPRMLAACRPGDVLVTMGAGNIGKFCDYA